MSFAVAVIPAKALRRRLLTNPDTYTTTLMAIALDTLVDGDTSLADVAQWSPETWFVELEEAYNVRLPPLVKEKLTVGFCLLTSDDFYKRPPRFVQICNVLSGGAINDNIFDKADLWECAWGLTEGTLLCPPPADDPEPFNEEIRYYLGYLVDEVGLKNPPDLLRLALSDRQATYDDLGTDPMLFQAGYQNQLELTASIEEMVQENLHEMMTELHSLELSQGNTKNLAGKIKLRPDR